MAHTVATLVDVWHDIENNLRPSPREPRHEVRKLRERTVHVLHVSGDDRFPLATVKNRHLVPTLDEPLHDRRPEESCSSQHHDPSHLRILGWPLCL